MPCPARVAVVVLLAVGVAACSDDEEPGAERYRQSVFSSVETTRNVEYGSVAGLDGQTVPLVADLYQPTGDEEPQRAAVVWVHGGGFAGGNRSQGPAAALAEAAAKAGFVALSIDYRLTASSLCAGDSAWSEPCAAAARTAAEDARVAVAWLRAQAEVLRVDPQRIGIAGESAGGIVAALVGMEGPPTVQAWVAISGGLPGGAGADATDAPGLLVAGTEDALIPYQWSVDTDAALRAVGVGSRLVALDGDGHVPWDTQAPRITAESLGFLADHLGTVEPVGDTDG